MVVLAAVYAGGLERFEVDGTVTRDGTAELLTFATGVDRACSFLIDLRLMLSRQSFMQ